MFLVLATWAKRCDQTSVKYNRKMGTPVRHPALLAVASLCAMGLGRVKFYEWQKTIKKNIYSFTLAIDLKLGCTKILKCTFSAPELVWNKIKFNDLFCYVYREPFLSSFSKVNQQNWGLTFWEEHNWKLENKIFTPQYSYTAESVK